MELWKIRWKSEESPIFNFRVGRKYLTLYDNCGKKRDVCRLQLTPEIQNILMDIGAHWGEEDEHRIIEVLWLLRARMHDIMKQKGMFSHSLFDGACLRFLKI